jgi:hypothetical protein
MSVPSLVACGRRFRKATALSAAGILSVVPCEVVAEPLPSMPNYILGTQAIGGKYQFTDKDPLLESAEVIHELGASNVKFALRVPKDDPAIRTVTDLVAKDPAHVAVLDLPFRDVFLWVDAREEGAWTKGLDPVQAVREYREVYELAVHLLKQYDGSGKRFYLGHWEGDNMLRPGGIGPAGDEAMADGKRVRGFIDWLRIRQQAIDDAKRDTPHADVEVWHYTEVNHPTISLLENRPSLASEVLPEVGVDFVSYSAYDSQADPVLMKRVLDYLEAQLKPKPGLAGKRVFLGEYGFWVRKDGQIKNTPETQRSRSLAVIRAGLEWGCPFILYWQLYNNELDADGSHRGFWMIDDQGVKQPVYHLHRSFYEWARRWYGEHGTGGDPPAVESAFRVAAIEFVKTLEAEGKP